MKDLRNYQQRGTPDCPIALHYVDPSRKKHLTKRRQPELGFIILKEGAMDCLLDSQTLHLSAGDVLAIAPQQLHGIVSHSPDVCYYALSVSLDAIAMPKTHVFQRDFVQPLQNGLLQLPSLLQPGHPAYEAVAEAVKKLPSCVMNRPNYKLYRYQTVVELCIAIAPWCIHLDDRMNDPLPDNTAVRNAMLYIHNKYHLPLDLKTIADHVHLHPNYLCALFKAQTGQTVLQYLTKKRVDAAVYLLRDSSLPVEVIAEKTGFGSRCLFYRHFREITGTTPKAYAKAQQHI